MLFNNNMSVQTTNAKRTDGSATRSFLQRIIRPGGSRSNNLDRCCCPIVIVVRLLKSKRRWNLASVHGQQDFDHANQTGSFQCMTDIGLHAPKKKSLLRQSAFRKRGAAFRQITQSFQLGRIAQLSAGCVSFHVIDIQHRRIAVGSLECQNLAFHSRSPQTTSFAVRCHADTANDTKNRQ